MRANANTMPMVEINFLCVHKKLRTKRLAPVLIKEITRRVNLRGIWQAAYTAGVVIPRPVASCRYWHRCAVGGCISFLPIVLCPLDNIFRVMEHGVLG